MSRVEKKKAEKKARNYVRLCLILQLILLVLGLVTVDLAIREMIGLYDVKLLGYEKINNQQSAFYILGDTLIIDHQVVEAKISEGYFFLERWIKEIMEWIISNGRKIIK